MASAPTVPTSVERQDQARAQVSSTAIWVALLRALESRKPPEERLIYDPLAEVLAKDDSVTEEIWKKSGRPKDFWVDFLALRTRWIDDRICAEAEAAPDLQLVIVGAGLDTRAYRLEGLRGKKVFEVDFAEVLEAKRTILSEGTRVTPTCRMRPAARCPGPWRSRSRIWRASAEPLACRATVGTDLSSGDGWMADLTAAGYSRKLPSLWLLEGLSGYLTEQELHALLKAISSLTPAGSRMLATFCGDSMRAANEATHMHRYYVRDEAQPSELLETHGWRTGSIRRLGAIAEIYRRAENIPRDYGYYISEAVREPSVMPSPL
uniref:S-adenosyl-L-methionine-dependent methyltransferase n=1 Tax=Alexandrium monilatum TaxID=311494 RepID=A0A7S4SZC5_9DINO